MKKFGTPIGAAPGSEKEKVGLAAVGTPPGVRSLLGGGGVGAVGTVGAVPPLGWVLFLVLGLPPVKPLLLCEEDLFFLPDCLPLFCLEDWPALFDPPLEPVGLDPAEVLVDAGAGLGVEAQDSATAVIGSLTGNDIADTGVPGGTFTVKVSFWPPTTVTVTTHWSAEAVG